MLFVIECLKFATLGSDNDMTRKRRTSLPTLTSMFFRQNFDLIYFLRRQLWQPTLNNGRAGPSYTCFQHGYGNVGQASRLRNLVLKFAASRATPDRQDGEHMLSGMPPNDTFLGQLTLP
jgi:hypothetical protein